MRKRYALRDDQWERIQDLLPGRAGHVGGTAQDNRRFVDAVTETAIGQGFPRVVPNTERFGDFRVSSYPFLHMRWSRSGVWEKVFKHLAADADNEYAMIDATIIRAHQHAAGAKGGFLLDRMLQGRSRGGLSSKLHATC